MTSQVITIDDLTSDVSAIARGGVSLCKAEADAAAVSNAGSQNELVPNLRARYRRRTSAGFAAGTSREDAGHERQYIQ